MESLLKTTEYVNINDLKMHPENYRTHPEDQLIHIIESIKKNGIYKNIVIANDNVILAGHGVYLAVKEIGLEKIPVVKLDIKSDSLQARKILTGDNEISKLGEIDDRALSEILKQIKEEDVLNLLGTGYDEMMLANLVMVTRPASEISDINEAAEWVGMPEHDSGKRPPQLIISFDNQDDKELFCKNIGFKITEKTKSVWWPIRDRDDTASLKIEI